LALVWEGNVVPVTWIGHGARLGRRPQQGALQWLGHLEAKKAVRRISIILAAFINDAQISMRFRLFIWNDLVEFS